MQCHCISIVRIWPEELRTSTCAHDNLCLAFISREAPSLNASECRSGSLNRFIRPVCPRVSRQLTGPTATRSNPTNEPTDNQRLRVRDSAARGITDAPSRTPLSPLLSEQARAISSSARRKCKRPPSIHPSIQLSLPPPPSPCYIPRRSKQTVGEGYDATHCTPRSSVSSCLPRNCGRSVGRPVVGVGSSSTL